MNKRVIFTAIACCSLLVACAPIQVGQQKIKDNSLSEVLVQRQVSKKEVYVRLGQPSDVRYSADKADASYWYYYAADFSFTPATYVPFVGLLAGGVDALVVQRIVSFDKNKVQNIETKYYKTTKNQWAGIAESSDALRKNQKSARVSEEMLKLHLPFDSTKAIELADIEVIVKPENEVSFISQK